MKSVDMFISLPGLPPSPVDLCAAALTCEGERPRPTSGSAADVEKKKKKGNLVMAKLTVT